MEEYIYSYVTKKRYYASKVCRVINPKQAALYLKNGLELLDVYYSVDYHSQEPIVVFIFDKAASYPFYELWKERELE